jgi:hypothetical protein
VARRASSSRFLYAAGPGIVCTRAGLGYPSADTTSRIYIHSASSTSHPPRRRAEERAASDGESVARGHVPYMSRSWVRKVGRREGRRGGDVVSEDNTPEGQRARDGGIHCVYRKKARGGGVVNEDNGKEERVWRIFVAHISIPSSPSSRVRVYGPRVRKTARRGPGGEEAVHLHSLCP